MRYSRPAVYIERSDASAAQPVLLRTDVAALVGIARRGPIHTPVLVESFRQFTAHFGEFTGAGYLAYAVRGFFENGGRRCWVVRVASRDVAGGARPASTTLADLAGAPALRVRASSSGVWGNALTLQWAGESGPAATSRPAATTPRYATVPSTAGFERGALVRIQQAGLTEYRVLSAVDADRARLYWVHPEPGGGLPTDRLLAGVDVLQPLRLSRVSYSLTVREAGRVIAAYRDLHLVASHERYVGRVLAEPDYTPSWLRTAGHEAPADLPRAPGPVVVTPSAERAAGDIPVPLDVPPDSEVALRGGAEGLAALRPDDFIGEPVVPGDSDFVKRRKTLGLQALAEIDEVALVAIPDILIRPEPDPVYAPPARPPANPCVPCPAPPPRTRLHQPVPPGELPPAFDAAAIARVQSALLAHCETLGDRFAVLSLPFDLASRPSGSREEVTAWRRLFDSRHGALYVPWLDVMEPRRNARTRRVPACGHLVGAIARTDLAEGVQRAPGNVALRGVTDLSRHLGEADHGELNLAGVNVIRNEMGRPATVGGARTLSLDPDWRFINVVRVVLTIEKAIGIALRFAAFEPNDRGTRLAVASTLGALLQLFFERGAFRGATPQESYFVRCDEVTTPVEAREAGRLVALVGVAPAAPSEFIVLRVGRERNALQVRLYEEVEAAHA